MSAPSIDQKEAMHEIKKRRAQYQLICAIQSRQMCSNGKPTTTFVTFQL